MPAQAVAAFEQADRVAAFGRYGRGFHACRPAADYHDPFPLRVRHGRQRAFAPIRFATADRIQRADQLAVLEQAGAALVAAVAADDFVLTALARFLHGERIGQQLPRQGNHVGRALAQHPLGRLQVAHLAHDEDLAAVAHDRLGAFAERRQPAFALAAFHAGQRQVQRVVAARGNVEEVEQAGRRQDLQLLLGLIGRDAALRPEKFVPGEPDADHVLRPDPRANLLGALDDEAAAFGRRAAVRVVARVVGRAHELAQPVAVRAMQFHPVDAGALDVRRGLAEVVRQLGDLVRPYHQRNLVVDDGWNARCAPDGFVAVDEHPPAVVDAHRSQLNEDGGVVFVHRVRQPPHGRNTVLAPHVHDVEERAQRAACRGHGLGDRQGHAAFGALAEIGDLSLRKYVVTRVAVLRTVRGLQNPVAQGEAAERERLPHARQRRPGGCAFRINCRSRWVCGGHRRLLSPYRRAEALWEGAAACISSPRDRYVGHRDIEHGLPLRVIHAASGAHGEGATGS